MDFFWGGETGGRKFIQSGLGRPGWWWFNTEFFWHVFSSRWSHFVDFFLGLGGFKHFCWHVHPEPWGNDDSQFDDERACIFQLRVGCFYLPLAFSAVSDHADGRSADEGNDKVMRIAWTKEECKNASQGPYCWWFRNPKQQPPFGWC